MPSPSPVPLPGHCVLYVSERFPCRRTLGAPTQDHSLSLHRSPQYALSLHFVNLIHPTDPGIAPEPTRHGPGGPIGTSWPMMGTVIEPIGSRP